MKTIQVDDDILAFLLANAVELNEPPSSILRRALRLDPPANAIEVDDDVYAFLVRRASSLNESASSILRRELHLAAPPTPPTPPAPPSPPTPPGPPAPTTIVFHIPAGTGQQPWNTEATSVHGRVGDTLRIVNDDGVSHTLHTSNNAPFPHPQELQPGQSADYPLLRPFAGPTLYDHSQGMGTLFWITVE